MRHYCPMCGEQWDDDLCSACGWREGKQVRYSEGPKVRPKHRLTPVQRKVLRWMKGAEGQVTFETGHKRTQLLEGDYDDQIVVCQSTVLHFLMAHGYVEQAGGIRRYMLTDKGKRAA